MSCSSADRCSVRTSVRTALAKDNPRMEWIPASVSSWESRWSTSSCSSAFVRESLRAAALAEAATASSSWLRVACTSSRARCSASWVSPRVSSRSHCFSSSSWRPFSSARRWALREAISTELSRRPASASLSSTCNRSCERPIAVRSSVRSFSSDRRDPSTVAPRVWAVASCSPREARSDSKRAFDSSSLVRRRESSATRRALSALSVSARTAMVPVVVSACWRSACSPRRFFRQVSSSVLVEACCSNTRRRSSAKRSAAVLWVRAVAPAPRSSRSWVCRAARAPASTVRSSSASAAEAFAAVPISISCRLRSVARSECSLSSSVVRRERSDSSAESFAPVSRSTRSSSVATVWRSALAPSREAPREAARSRSRLFSSWERSSCAEHLRKASWSRSSSARSNSSLGVTSIHSSALAWSSNELEWELEWEWELLIVVVVFGVVGVGVGVVLIVFVW
mmetsp:Transcript_2181/g.5783  ORF Transcript_2181/g.5783 Transcript_2181/m.5783 type:complete len:455 (+) Transcript_2181:391-1755(+)